MLDAWISAAEQQARLFSGQAVPQDGHTQSVPTQESLNGAAGGAEASQRPAGVLKDTSSEYFCHFWIHFDVCFSIAAKFSDQLIQAFIILIAQTLYSVALWAENSSVWWWFYIHFNLQKEEAIQAVTGILADLLYFPMESDLEMRTLISTGQTPRPLLEYDAKIKVS